jgi:hypothetical protein
MDRQYQTEAISELTAALAKAQGEIKNAAKDVKNTFFKTSYADLAGCYDASREYLAKNGLSVVQFPDYDETGTMFLMTQLNHASGQWMRSWYPVRPVKNDPPGLGSAMTYARRYSYCAMVGVAAEDDDDGNAASSDKEIVSTEQALEIDLLITEVKADKANFLKFIGASDVSQIPLAKYQSAIDALSKKKVAAA